MTTEAQAKPSDTETPPTADHATWTGSTGSTTILTIDYGAKITTAQDERRFDPARYISNK